MDKQFSNHDNSKNSFRNYPVGNTNRRYYQKNQKSTTNSINFSLPSPSNIINRPFLPGCKKNRSTSLKDSDNSDLNKYKLIEKEFNLNKPERKKNHSHSYSNVFSTNSNQFKDKDNCLLAKPNLNKSNLNIFNRETNSVNDLYKVENFLSDNNKLMKDETLIKPNIREKLVSKKCEEQNFVKPMIILTQSSIESKKEEDLIIKSSFKSLIDEEKIKKENNFDFLLEKHKKKKRKSCLENLFEKFSNLKKENSFDLLKKWYIELILTFLLIFCIFNAIKTNNFSNDNVPTNFFQSNFLVKDFYYGQISELSDLAIQNEVTFVMYYSPRDEKCIKFKNEYQTIAKHYTDQIFFAAVNCLWRNGECYKSYKIKKYPVFIAHIRNIGEVEYKGPLVAIYIIPFLDNLLNPVRQILNEGDLLDLKTKHDGIVVGYFDFNKSLQPKGYQNFLLASIKSLYQDPWRKVQFAIVSSRKAAYKLYIENQQTIFLYTWNNTYSYKNKLKKIENFLNWIYDTLHNDGLLIEWITPVEFESDTLSLKLLTEPTLILFTPRSLILGLSPYYDILKEVAMDYFNCDNSPQIKSLIHRNILRRRLKEEKLFELEEKCHEISKANSNFEENREFLPKDFLIKDQCCHSQLVNWIPQGKLINKKCMCTACVTINQKACPSGCKKFNCLATASRYLTNFEPNSYNKTINFCDDIKFIHHPKFSLYYNIKIFCSGILMKENNLYKLKNNGEDILNDFQNTKIIDNANEKSDFIDESMQRMMKNFEEHHCHRLNLGLNYNDLNFPDSGEGNLASSQKWRQNFTGLGCNSQNYLSFIAIDSLMYQNFTESLGLNVLDETHATLVLIVEAQEEAIYVLNSKNLKKENQISTINKKMIYEFIKNYSNKKLTKFSRENFGKISSSDSCLIKNDKNSESTICIPEISTHNFIKKVLDKKKDVLLMYYTPWCSYCTSVTQIFITVAKFFSNIDNIFFSRINCDLNELPIEYSVNKYPSLILFPSSNKNKLISFPSNTSITTSNLLEFVLNNINEETKLQSVFQLCDKKCLKKSFLKYTLEVRKINLEIFQIRKFSRKNNDKKLIMNLANIIRLKLMQQRKGFKIIEVINQRLKNNKFNELLKDQLVIDMVNLLNKKKLKIKKKKVKDEL